MRTLPFVCMKNKNGMVAYCNSFRRHIYFYALLNFFLTVQNSSTNALIKMHANYDIFVQCSNKFIDEKSLNSLFALK